MNASAGRDTERHTGQDHLCRRRDPIESGRGEAREGETERGRGACVFLFYVPLIINKENAV